MNRYRYAREKFSRAIYSLATGKDEIRKRLLIVFQSDLMMIRPEHLPEECHEDYAWVMKTITKFDEKYKGQKKEFTIEDGRFDHLIPGRIESTLYRIKKETGAKIAKKIYSIWHIVNTQYNQ
jgi:hypothetical protein